MTRALPLLLTLLAAPAAAAVEVYLVPVSADEPSSLAFARAATVRAERCGAFGRLMGLPEPGSEVSDHDRVWGRLQEVWGGRGPQERVDAANECLDHVIAVDRSMAPGALSRIGVDAPMERILRVRCPASAAGVPDCAAAGYSIVEIAPAPARAARRGAPAPRSAPALPAGLRAFRW